MGPIHAIVGGYSRAGDIAGLLGDYNALMERRAEPASTPTATPQPPALLRQAIDKPSRGVRAFNSLTTARDAGNLKTGKAFPQRPDPDDQGNLPTWTRLQRKDHAALEAIPGNNHVEQPIQPERAYLRRVGEEFGHTRPTSASTATVAPPVTSRTEAALATRMAGRCRANLLRLCSQVGEALPTLPSMRPLAMAG